jgi:hypothetical protein
MKGWDNFDVSFTTFVSFFCRKSSYSLQIFVECVSTPKT